MIDTFFEGLHPEDRSKTEAILNRALDPAGKGEYYAELLCYVRSVTRRARGTGLAQAEEQISKC